MSEHRVLLVEDMEYWHLRVQRILTAHPEGSLCEIDWAKNKTECMNFLAENFYSLVLMDLHLYGPDSERQGYDLTLELLDYFIDHDQKKTPVVVFSNYARLPDEIREAYDAGAIDVVSKPTSPDDEDIFYRNIRSKFLYVNPTPPPVGSQPSLQVVNKNNTTCVFFGSSQLPIKGKPLKILIALVQAKGVAFRDQLMKEAELGSLNALDVHLSKVRSTLRPFDISIERCDERHVIAYPTR